MQEMACITNDDYQTKVKLTTQAETPPPTPVLALDYCQCFWGPKLFCLKVQNL